MVLLSIIYFHLGYFLNKKIKRLCQKIPYLVVFSFWFVDTFVCAGYLLCPVEDRLSFFCAPHSHVSIVVIEYNQWAIHDHCCID